VENVTDSEFIGVGIAIGTLAYVAVMFFFVRWWTRKRKKNRRKNHA
jgi:hypothetical protein